jgi:HEAT repeat protein
MHAFLFALLLITEQQVKAVITPLDKVDDARIAQLKGMGPEALPVLARIYTQSNENDRAVIAWIFYSIGAKSPEARKVLLQDIHTQNEKLRLQVQWALGRVSDDTEVVDILIGIMRDDPNALFRDKAACALAYDQIHLSEKQKVLLYRKLIDALSDPKMQVRAVAIQALSIHTGQTKGFMAGASDEARSKSIAAWRSWLAEYEKNL